MEHQDYYVYVYLDPTKIGKFNYGEFEFEFEPFYIGKGRQNRHNIHLQKVKRNDYTNLPKFHRIKKILDTGTEPIIIKYKTLLLENNAFNIESEMIINIGRKDKKTGPLTNLSDGGEGNGNRIFTEEHRRNISLSKKGIVTEKHKEHLARLHKSMTGNKRTLGMKFTKCTRDKMSVSASKRKVDQFDLNHTLLNEFESIAEAKRKTKVNPSAVLRGRGKTAGGFIWRYHNKDI